MIDANPLSPGTGVQKQGSGKLDIANPLEPRRADPVSAPLAPAADLSPGMLANRSGEDCHTLNFVSEDVVSEGPADESRPRGQSVASSTPTSTYRRLRFSRKRPPDIHIEAIGQVKVKRPG